MVETASGRGRDGLIAAIVLSVIAVIGAAPLTAFVLYVEHRMSYQGTCGPHAPDIAEHPCTADEHAAEFGAGFAFIGLLVFSCGGSIAALFVVGALWTIWATARAIRARRRPPAPRVE
jgi:hypothetical protein